MSDCQLNIREQTPADTTWDRRFAELSPAETPEPESWEIKTQSGSFYHYISRNALYIGKRERERAIAITFLGFSYEVLQIECPKMTENDCLTILESRSLRSSVSRIPLPLKASWVSNSPWLVVSLVQCLLSHGIPFVCCVSLSIGLFPLLYSYRSAGHTKLGSALARREHILFGHLYKDLIFI